MLARAPLVAIALAAPACYSPTLDPCTVHCPNNDPCPGASSCGVDQFCHDPGDMTDCSTAQFRVTINKVGDGTGTVSGDGGLSCGTSCSAQFPQGTTIHLDAMRDNDSRFAQWNDLNCGSQTEQCTLTVDGDKVVEAEFHLASAMTVQFFNNGGTGTVTSDPPGLSCTSDCTVLFDQNVTVTLSATTTNTFGGFSGPDCPFPSLTCVETMNNAITVQAEFDP